MRRLAVPFAIILLLSAVAGCIGAGDDEEPTTGSNDGPTPDSPEAANASEPYRFGSHVDETQFFNDSFPPASCFACPDSENRHDITGMLAEGGPTLVQAEVDADANAFDGTSVFVDGDGAEIYRQNGTFDEVTALVAPQGGTVEVVVQNGFPDANTEIAYELRVETLANASAVPAEVPLAIDKPEQPARLSVNATGLEGEAHLMLWDGEDAFVGHYPLEEETTVNVSEAAGDELVVYLAGGEGIARLAPANASATGTEGRALATTIEAAGASVPTNGALEVAADIAPVPLRGGLYLQGSLQTGASYQGQLQADGETIESFESGGYLTGQETRFTWWGEPGDPRLDAEEHLGVFEFTAASGGEAGVLWETYER
jgi:hypothetical protein